MTEKKMQPANSEQCRVASLLCHKIVYIYRVWMWHTLENSFNFQQLIFICIQHATITTNHHRCHTSADTPQPTIFFAPKAFNSSIRTFAFFLCFCLDFAFCIFIQKFIHQHHHRNRTLSTNADLMNVTIFWIESYIGFSCVPREIC